MMINSAGCIKTFKLPCSIKYPASTAPKTTTIPMIENIDFRTSGLLLTCQERTVTQFPPFAVLSFREAAARATSDSGVSPARQPAPPTGLVTENLSPHHSIYDRAIILLTRSPTRDTSDSLHSNRTAINRFSPQQPIGSVERRQFSTACADSRRIESTT